ncbi:MAG: tetratricopeptide repeat protein [Methylophilaceae bacterium]|jgi:predicted negative regulator of RcsB-dependent stress response|nr:tetratricopeptide repeat protein [Methylophilaceae bacterium]
MAFDNDEQQSEHFKNFYNLHKFKIFSAIAVFLVAFFAYQYLESVNQSNDEEASQLFQDVIVSKIGNIDEIKLKVGELQNDFSNSPYAARASIYYSKLLVETGDYTAAAKELIWASGENIEPSIQSMANYLLGNLYLVEKKLDEALEVANKIITDGYIGLANDLKGDIYLAKGDKENAIKSYELALNYFGGQGELHKVIENKLNSISQ